MIENDIKLSIILVTILKKITFKVSISCHLSTPSSIRFLISLYKYAINIQLSRYKRLHSSQEDDVNNSKL